MTDINKIKTFYDTITETADDIEKKIVNFLIGEHSSISRWHYPQPGITYCGGEYKFQDLSIEGRRMQSRLFKEFNTFSEMILVITSGLTKEDRNKVKQSIAIIVKYIEQSCHLHHANISKIQNEIVQAFLNIKTIIGYLHDDTEDDVLIIPDTNTLIGKPLIEKWIIPNVDRFEVVIFPTVLAEIDLLKVDRRKTQDVQDKAKSLSKMIKEYIRRGDISEGIDVVKGKIRLRAVAVEPNFACSLPWLDKDNNDDRIIASFVEILKSCSRTKVFLATGDINLMNKVVSFKLPYINSDDIELANNSCD